MNDIDLQTMREIAGIGQENPREKEKEWADKQITNVQQVPNQAPTPELDNFMMTKEGTTDHNLQGLSDRLNSQFGSDFGIKVERLD